MLHPLLALFALAAAAPAQSEFSPLPREVPLRVMTFNVWHGGGEVAGGRDKIVDAILAAGADLVGMQETNGVAAYVAQRLGWYAYMPDTTSLSILSRHPIVERFPLTLHDAGLGARLRVREQPLGDVVFWVCHLDYDPYGPYQACFEGRSTSYIVNQQNQNQTAEVDDILAAMAPELADADRVPVFLVGDFNTPSHLDWTAATAATHCGYQIAWPATVAVAAAGFQDSYRLLHPDPLLDPAATWSPIFPWNSAYQRPEPQDRIDLVHFAGRGARVRNSTVFVLGTPQAYPNHAGNAWPSDHAAVVSEFRVRPRTGAAAPLPGLALDRASYRSGEPITATFANGPGNARDWLGFYPAGNAPQLNAATTWAYTNGSRSAGTGTGPSSGSVRFAAGSGPAWPLPPGDYYAYFLCCDAWDPLGLPVRFTVTP